MESSSGQKSDILACAWEDRAVLRGKASKSRAATDQDVFAKCCAMYASWPFLAATDIPSRTGMDDTLRTASDHAVFARF